MLRKLIPVMLLLLFASQAPADNQAIPTSPLRPNRIQAQVQLRNIDLGKAAYRGVVATADLKPLPNMPGGETYLLSVGFSSQDTGRPLSEGDVAVKVISAKGKSAVPIRLNPVAGRFQAEIQLSMAGESEVRIGSKLADKKKRIYRFYFTPDL